MKRGSMLKRFKQRLEASGPGVTVAVIAMVLALTGGAFAAAGKLTGPQKKEVEKIAKKVSKPGKPGAAGPAGPAGKDGTNGTNGKDGTNGKNGDPGTPGTPGTPGANGKSAVVTTEPSGANCPAGGANVEVEGQPGTKKTICNGKEGSPWTAGGVLPPGSTETGTWAYTATAADTNGVRVPLSFPIPLNADGSTLDENHVHFNPPEGDPNCAGAPAVPLAAPGHLCVYVSGGDFPENVTFTGICTMPAAVCTEKGANSAGALLSFSAPTGVSTGSGTFAVTAPNAP